MQPPTTRDAEIRQLQAYFANHINDQLPEITDSRADQPGWFHLRPGRRYWPSVLLAVGVVGWWLVSRDL